MVRSISNIRKKRGRGRPKLGAIPVLVRLLPAQAALLDEWRKNTDDKPGRPEAIRRILEQNLPRPHEAPVATMRSGEKASDLADRAAQRLVDKSLPPEEQQRRKRSLIKGPKEFRDIREDVSRSKR
jgi:hypothetical protein